MTEENSSAAIIDPRIQKTKDLFQMFHLDSINEMKTKCQIIPIEEYELNSKQKRAVEAMQKWNNIKVNI